MIGLDKLIEYIDNHPRLIIGTLLSIIFVGGLGGGLWISTIKENLAQQKELNDSRLNLIDEKYKSSISKLSSRYDDFEYDISRLKKSIAESSDSLTNLARRLQETVKLEDKSIIKKEVTEISENILDRQAEIDTQLSKLEKEVEESYANFKDDIGEILPYEYHPIPTWIIILGAVFIIWALIFTFKRND